MKNILAILTLLFSFICYAGPVPLEAGQYNFKGYEVVQKKHVENVYSSNAEGKKRLTELQNQNYNCQHVNNLIYQCSAFVSYAGTENEVAKSVNDFAAPLKLEFSAPLGNAYLISEGEAIKEYIVPQRVEFQEKNYSSYRYIVRENSESLFFGDPAQATFVIDPTGKIRYSFPLTLKKSKNSIYKYLVLINFELISR